MAALRQAALALLLLGVGGCHRSAPAAPAAPDLAESGGLPMHGSLTSIHLIDQDGHAFAAEQLRGRVWIAAFMYTTCPMECPILTQRMAYIQKLLATRRPNIQLLSISVNPGQDTPAVLRAYGTRFHRDAARWTFLTGDTDPLLKAVAAGYQRGVAAARPGGFVAQHGEYLVLLDGAGQIRGYYRKDDAEVTRLLSDADALAAALPR